jgi:hypothetical protein
LSDGSAVGLRIPGLRQRPVEFLYPKKSTRHASQGRPAGMERGAKNGFAIHRTGLFLKIGSHIPDGIGAKMDSKTLTPVSIDEI